MRQFFSIALVIIYFLLSAGLQLRTHYCHGKLESVKVLVEADKCCCGDNEMKSNCCSDEILSFEADMDYHLTTESRISIDHYQIITKILVSFIDNTIEAEENKFDKRDFESPPTPKQPIWLLNSSFTFYG